MKFSNLLLLSTVFTATLTVLVVSESTSTPSPNSTNESDEAFSTTLAVLTISEHISTTPSSHSIVNGTDEAPALIASNSNATAQSIQILKDIRSHPKKSGEYSYEIHVSDGTVLKQSGKLGEDPKDPEADPSLVITGEYEFLDPTGMRHKVTYIADKRGFRPVIGVVGLTSDSSLGVANNTNTANTKNANLTEPKKRDEPLETISSSLFSSPER